MHVDEALKRFAASGATNERVSVLIEPKARPVAAPAKNVQAAERKPERSHRRDRDGDAFRVVARDLAALHVEVTPLELVGSMVAELTPGQLRQVMNWSGVAAIRENRGHRTIRTTL